MTRRLLPVVAMSVVFLLGALPAQATDDEPVDPAAVFDTFSVDFDPVGRIDRPTARNAIEATDVGYGGTGARVEIAKRSYFGADLQYDFGAEHGAEPERMWFRYYIRLDDDFSMTTGGKLPGFSGIYSYTGKGGYPGTPYSPGWSARLRMYASRDDGSVPIGYYLYHPDQRGRYGDSHRFAQPAGALVPDRWHCIEGYIAMNTPGERDGELRAYVDGTPVFTADDMRFRRKGEDGVRIESFWFDVYHGGKQRAPRTLGMSIDEVVISSDRPGCGFEAAVDPVTGDIDGDGLEETVSWRACVGGCLMVEGVSDDGIPTRTRMPGGTRLSARGFELGLVAADVDRNGDDEVIYVGSCDGPDCWIVHGLPGTGKGGSWGVVDLLDAVDVQAVDVDGDRREDLVVTYRCSSGWCLRVHRSVGGLFDDPITLADGLPAPPRRLLVGEFDAEPGLDLLLSTECTDGGTCFYLSSAVIDGVASLVPWGVDDIEADVPMRVVDVDEDGRDDLVFVESCGVASCVQMMRNAAPGFTDRELAVQLPAGASSVSLGSFAVDDLADVTFTVPCRDGDRCGMALARPPDAIDLRLPKGFLIDAGLARLDQTMLALIV